MVGTVHPTKLTFRFCKRWSDMSDKHLRQRRSLASAVIVFVASYLMIAIFAPVVVAAIFGRRGVEFFTNFWAQLGAWLVLLAVSALLSSIEYRLSQKRQRDVTLPTKSGVPNHESLP